MYKLYKLSEWLFFCQPLHSKNTYTYSILSTVTFWLGLPIRLAHGATFDPASRSRCLQANGIRQQRSNRHNKHQDPSSGRHGFPVVGESNQHKGDTAGLTTIRDRIECRCCLSESLVALFGWDVLLPAVMVEQQTSSLPAHSHSP